MFKHSHILHTLLGFAALLISRPLSAQLYWDGGPPGVPNNGTIEGGAGTWNAANTNWTNAAGTVNTLFSDGSSAVFGGTGGAISLTAPFLVSGIAFTSNGYVVTKNANTSALSFAANTNVDVSGANTATLDIAVAGPIGFTKTGTGTLILKLVQGSPTTFDANLSVSNGILEMQSGFSGNQIGFAVNANTGGSLYHGYSNGGGYTNGITINGAGAASANGIYILGGTTLTENNITLSTAPTTIRSYGTGNAFLRGFDINNASLTVNTAASGSSSTSTVNFNTGTYGYRFDIAAGANTTTGDFIVNGAISGGPGIYKRGTGSLVLTGVSTYSGATSIIGGRVFVDGTLSGTGAVTVATTATLAGSGSLAGATTLQTGATLSPGADVTGALAGIGTLSFGSDLTLNSGSATILQLAAALGNVGSLLPGDIPLGIDPTTQHDSLEVAGLLTANGTIQVTLQGGYAPQVGDYFDLFDTASGGLTGAYSLQLPGLTGGYAWNTSLFASQGILFVVPEPGKLPLLILGMTGAWFMRRRKRSMDPAA